MKNSLSEDKSCWGFKYALRGLIHTIRTESHMRFHICAGIGTLMFTEYYDFTVYDYAFLVLAIFLVLAAEMVNTAVEHTVDLCTNEYREKAKSAKDASAGFVLLASLYALFTAFVLFWEPKLLFASLVNIFTRVKYIVFFVLTGVFVAGVGIKEKTDDR